MNHHIKIYEIKYILNILDAKNHRKLHFFMFVVKIKLDSRSVRTAHENAANSI